MKGFFLFILLTAILSTCLFLPIESVSAASYTIHFVCQTMNRGNQGSISFNGATYADGQSNSFPESDSHWIVANVPAPTSDWNFYRWQAWYFGDPSWVNDIFDQDTWFHLHSETYLYADFYAPIETNSPQYSTLYYGEKQRITGTARQYYGQQLSVNYYPIGLGWGPRVTDGSPPPEFGCDVAAGYLWTTVNVGSYPGTFDTGLITPQISRYSPDYTLPMEVKVFTGYHVGNVEEVDSNVVSFEIIKAPVMIAAPNLEPTVISQEDSVTITGEIFSRYYIDANDMTGTWIIEASHNGGAYAQITSDSFTSIQDYSTVYEELGVLHRISYSWTPPLSGTYDVRIDYDGNRYYEGETSPSSMLTVGGAVDLGVNPQIQRKDTKMLCLSGCPLNGDHAWDGEHSDNGCDHEARYCAMASISMVNSYYGGNLHQDRIRYYQISELNSNPDSPEGDLDHGEGTDPDDMAALLEWALNDAYVFELRDRPNFETIKFWIDYGRPIIRCHETGSGTLHATVIDGYEDSGSMVHVLDPDDGSESSEPYLTLPVLGVWVASAGSIGRQEEDWNSNFVPDIAEDYDGDGLCDFDEIYRFITFFAHPDTDGDLVYDKEEIISYTFLSNGDWDSNDDRLPNLDNDYDDQNRPLRCELDIDSDNGGTPDGLEDLNRNGIVDVGETDPLDASDDPLAAASVKVTALSPINILVTDPIGRNVGFDPITQSVVNEIPGATYTGPGSEPQVITIPNSLNGTYIIEAFGTDTGEYEVIMESLDSNSSVLDSDTWQGIAAPGEQHSETMTLEADGSLVLPHDIEVTNLVFYKTVVGQEYSVFINVTFENRGNFSEAFNFTAYANMSIIDAFRDVALERGGSITITFEWNTTGFEKGYYNVSAIVDAVPGEADVSDNSLEEGSIFVTIPGDVDGDRDVDIFDIVAMATIYGVVKPGPDYDPDCDIDGDGNIDIFDIVAAATHYGETW